MRWTGRLSWRARWWPSADEGGWFGRFATLARENGVWLAGSLLEERRRALL